jgi:hypothetical protein
LAQISGLHEYTVAACCVERLLELIRQPFSDQIISISKKLLGHRPQTYLDALKSAPPRKPLTHTSQDESSHQQSHFRLFSPAYPLLIHLDVLCSSTIIDLSHAILLASDMETCSVLTNEEKERALVQVWFALFRANLLLYDCDAPIQTSLFVLFVPYAGALAIEVFIRKFQELAKIVQECDHLTRSVKDYLDMRIRQTMLRLLYNRYAGIPPKYHDYCGIPQTISSAEQKKWICRFMDLELETPPYLLQVSMNELQNILYPSMDEMPREICSEVQAIAEAEEVEEFHDANEDLEEHQFGEIAPQGAQEDIEVEVVQEIEMNVCYDDKSALPIRDDTFATATRTSSEHPAARSPQGSVHSSHQSFPEPKEAHSDEDSMESGSLEQSIGSGHYASSEENYEEEETDDMKEVSHSDNVHDDTFDKGRDIMLSHGSEEEQIEVVDHETSSEDEVVDDFQEIETQKTGLHTSRVAISDHRAGIQASPQSFSERKEVDFATQQVHAEEAGAEDFDSCAHPEQLLTGKEDSEGHIIVQSEIDQQSTQNDIDKDCAQRTEKDMGADSFQSLPGKEKESDETEDAVDSNIPTRLTRRSEMSTLESCDYQIDVGYEAEDSQDAGTEEEAERPQESIGIGLSLYPAETSVDGSNMSSGKAEEFVDEPAVANSTEVDQGYDAEDSHGHDESPLRKRLPAGERKQFQLEKGYEAEDSQFEDEDHTEDEEDNLQTEHREHIEQGTTAEKSQTKHAVRGDIQTLSDMSAADEAEASELEDIGNRTEHTFLVHSGKPFPPQEAEHPSTLHAFATKAQSMDEEARAQARRSVIAFQEQASRKTMSIVDKVPKEGIEALRHSSDSTISVVGSQQGNSIETTTSLKRSLSPDEVLANKIEENIDHRIFGSDERENLSTSRLLSSHPDGSNSNNDAIDSVVEKNSDEKWSSEKPQDSSHDEDTRGNQLEKSSKEVKQLDSKTSLAEDEVGSVHDAQTDRDASSDKVPNDLVEADTISKSIADLDTIVVPCEEAKNDVSYPASVFAPKSGQKRKLEEAEPDSLQNAFLDEDDKSYSSQQQKNKRSRAKGTVSSPMSTRSGMKTRSSTKKETPLSEKAAVKALSTVKRSRRAENPESTSVGSPSSRISIQHSVEASTKKKEVSNSPKSTRRSAVHTSRSAASPPMSTRSSGRLTRSSTQRKVGETSLPSSSISTRSRTRKRFPAINTTPNDRSSSVSRTRSSARGGDSSLTTGKNQRTPKKPPVNRRGGRSSKEKRSSAKTSKSESFTRKRKAIPEEQIQEPTSVQTRTSKRLAASSLVRRENEDHDSVGAVRRGRGAQPPVPSSERATRSRSSKK